MTEEKIPQKPEEGKGIVPDKNPNATYPHKCEKCGYGFAEIIEKMPEYSDEDTFVYLKCGKCGWTQQLSRKTK